MQSLTSSLVAEMGESTGVSVFNFAPGMIDTPTFNAAAEQVAPRMGLTPEQFKHLGVNPGYEGLMPAEDCAAGLAYAIVHAKENHGQTADAFKPLIASGAIRMSATAETAHGKKPSASADRHTDTGERSQRIEGTAKGHRSGEQGNRRAGPLQEDLGEERLQPEGRHEHQGLGSDERRPDPRHGRARAIGQIRCDQRQAPLRHLQAGKAERPISAPRQRMRRATSRTRNRGMSRWPSWPAAKTSLP